MAAGTVQAIFIAPKARVLLEAVAAVRAVPGLGLDGDRYFLGRGALSRWPGPARAVSLIDAEVLEAVRREHGLDLTAGRSRRNLVTAGVVLPGLRGRTFRVGGAVLRGVGPCSPCGYLDRLAGAGACAALKGRDGLRAAVLEEGVIRVGDFVEVMT
jgi:MOSC domain-containing protein YiiM